MAFAQRLNVEEGEGVGGLEELEAGDLAFGVGRVSDSLRTVMGTCGEGQRGDL